MANNLTPVPQKSWAETPPIAPMLRRIVGGIVENQTWLEQLANPFQSWVQKLFGKPGDPQYVVKDALNGTWLGHPLHPVDAAIPVGAWTCTTVLDLVALGNEDSGLEQGADLTLWVGLSGAVAAIFSGLTQWSDIDGIDRRTGLFHGILNSSATLLYVGSALLRLTGQRKTAVALSTTGYATTLLASYLGGEMSFGKGIGVNHAAFEGGSDDFVAVMDEKDLPENKLTRVDAAGMPAVLVRQKKAIYAIAATCSHLGGPLDEGTLEDGNVICPWHGSCFRMSDGSIVNGPATYAQPTFAVRVRDGKIELKRLVHA